MIFEIKRFWGWDGDGDVMGMLFCWCGGDDFLSVQTAAAVDMLPPPRVMPPPRMYYRRRGSCENYEIVAGRLK